MLIITHDQGGISQTYEFPGEYYKKNNYFYMVYNQKISEEQIIKNIIKFDNNSLVRKQFGINGFNIKFEKNLHYKSAIYSQNSSFNIYLLTNNFQVNFYEESHSKIASIIINYKFSFNSADIESGIDNHIKLDIINVDEVL